MSENSYVTIVVGTDGSALAEPTVARAAAIAADDGARLVVVCAFAEMSRRQEARNPATLGGDARIGQVLGRAAASDAVTAAAKVAEAHGAAVQALVLMDGDPAEVLLKSIADHGAQLLVVGARQDVSIAERLLGTVATEVVRKAPCDVLVVRPPVGLPTGDLAVPENA